MPRITFVYPDFESLGIEYLMSVCLEAGYDVDYVHYEAEDPYIGRKEKKFSAEHVAQRIADTEPDVVGFSCVTDNYRHQLRCAGVLKQMMPNVITVFGGVHPTAVPERVIRNPEVDCIAVGEAELSFSEFLKAGKSGGGFALPSAPIKGIVYKKNGELVGGFEEGELADLDKLPFPYKTLLFSTSKQLSHIYRIITSRGCPYNCSYCFNTYLHKVRERHVVRQRTVDNVIDELKWAKAEYPVRFVWFDDDAFTTNSKWIVEFCDRYKSEIGLPFTCAANPHYMNSTTASTLSSAGCINVQIGVQSLSEELCAGVLQRRSSNARIAQAITDLKEAGIMVQVDHMLGIPGDTLELEEQGALFYNKYRPNLISVFWLTYYPKTRIVETAKQEGLLTEDDISSIEEGEGLGGNGNLTGGYISRGSMKDPRPYYGIAFLFNYLPILPRWLVSFLVKSRMYRVFRVRNFFISTVLPRFIQAVFNRKDYRARTHIARFIDRVFMSRFRRST